MDDHISVADIQANPSRAATSFRISSGQLVAFRPLVAGDAPILGQYFLGLSDDTKSRFGPHPFDQATADALCASIDYAATIRMIATVAKSAQERVIAYFILILDVTDGERERYRRAGITLDSQTNCTLAPSVADSFQDQGLGSRLVAHTIHLARRLGRKRMVLLGGVQATNQRGIHFYQKHGLRKIGEFESPAGRYNYDMVLEL